MRWAPQKNDVLAALAADILHNYSRGRVIVAVDGLDGAGKSHFGAELAEAVRSQGHAVSLASIDAFHRPRVERYRQGRESPRGFYEDSYDYEQFRRLLVDPFKRGEPFVAGAFNLVTDSPELSEPQQAPADAILIVEGIFLHRPELRGIWNFSIWLDVPLEVSHARLVARDGENGMSERYSGGQAIYAREKPRSRATAIVDYSDFDHPRRVFADSC